MKSLSSCGGVHFYCRNCEFNLTRSPLSDFVEMPSVDWREVADNWFGACCCSFGGISEKLVARFANSYTSAKGVCLLNFATVTVCKDDLVGCNFPESNKHEGGPVWSSKPEFGELTPNLNACDEKLRFTISTTAEREVNDEETNNDRLSRMRLDSDLSGNDYLAKGCCAHHESESHQENQKLDQNAEILENQQSFLNGFLGNIFMVKSSNLSADVEWVEYFCPQCSTLLGAYPCGNGGAPVDGGVRLFKCNISTGLPIGGSGDLFRKYTLERMFTNQLLDFAKDELSYRTVVRDLKTNIPMLLIVIMNTNSWSCTGSCLSKQSSAEAVPKLDLHPVVKVLFTEGSSKTESEIRKVEDRIKKDLTDEVFMLRPQIEDMVESLVSAKNMLPSSCSSLQGLSLSSMPM